MRAILRAAGAIIVVALAPQRRFDTYHAQMAKRTPDQRSAGASEMRHHAGEG